MKISEAFPEYRNKSELKYFGSDYNKYLNSLNKEMTVNNIDCIQYKRSKKILRIVESKHENEDIKKTQLEIFEILSKVAAYFLFMFGINFQIYIVIGNPPYHKLYVKNIITKAEKILYDEDVKNFSELEISI